MEQKQDLTADEQLAKQLQEMEFDAEIEQKKQEEKEGVVFRDDGMVEIPLSDDVTSRLYKVMQEQRLSSISETIQFLMKFSADHGNDMEIS